MINRNNKKGFTIVELVIVIAVIAILAAVLIPTFAGIIKKANLSADQQAVRQMNTALAMAGEVKGSTEVIAALDEAGYNSEKMLLPVSKGHFFFYVPSENLVVLVDADKKVVFPESAECYGSTVPEGSYNLVLGYETVIPTDGKTLADAIVAVDATKNIGIVGSLTSEDALTVDTKVTFYTQAGSTLTVPSTSTTKTMWFTGESATVNTSFIVSGESWENVVLNFQPELAKDRFTVKCDSGETIFTLNGDKAMVRLEHVDIILKDGQKLASITSNSYNYALDFSADSTINGVKVAEITDEQWAQYVDIAEGGYMEVNGDQNIGIASFPQY